VRGRAALDRLLRRARSASSATLIVTVMLLVIAGLAVAHAYAFRATELDDAYITYRHAENLAKFQGPVFNPGERVEGSSTFSLIVVLALSSWLRIPPTVAGPLLGVAAFVCLVLLSYASVTLIVRDRTRYALGLAAATIVAAATPLAYYAPTGMETTSYALLVLLGLYLHLANALDGRFARAWPIVLGLAALTRPEGVAFFGLLFASWLGRRLLVRTSFGKRLFGGSEPPPKRALLREALGTFGWFVLVFGPLLVFRLAYYGAWVPNSVLAKSGAMDPVRQLPLGEAFDALSRGQGIAMAGEFLAKWGMAVILPLPGLLRARTRYATLVLLAFSAACIAVPVWNDGDWFPNFRLLTPVVAPFAIAIALGLHAALVRTEPRRWAALAPFAALVLLLTWKTADGLFYERRYEFPHTQITNYMRWLGRTLKSVARDDDLYATDMVGIIPYYSGLRTLDVLGLCDPHIARHGQRFGAMGKTDWKYVIERKPTYYQFNFPEWVKRLYGDPDFASQVDDYWALLTPGYLATETRDRKLLLVRKDRPELERLVKATNGKLVDPRQELRRLRMW